MKALLAAVITLTSINAMAIEFITPEEVLKKVGGERILEIGRAAARGSLQEESECGMAIMSRSARAYVVIKDGKEVMYVTPSGLAGLIQCEIVTAR